MTLQSSLSLHQSAMSKNCVKLLCEDPVFAEYIKCILMDERTFLNNNIVYTFLTHFLLKVRGLVAIISISRNAVIHAMSVWDTVFTVPVFVV